MSTPTLLVVEDNPMTRKIVGIALRGAGYTVLEAVDGASALELMRDHRPQLVLQDLVLPDTDGFELARQLRRIGGEDFRLIAFSGFISPWQEGQVSVVGFDDVITKPIEPLLLVQLIGAHVPRIGLVEDKFGRGRQVVLVDDDPLQLKLARVQLERLGFSVQTAENGEAALAVIKRQRPDLIVSDVMMPLMDGFELSLRVRQMDELREIPILLVTSTYLEASDRELALRAGANELLVRTPELQELVTAIARVFSSKSPMPLATPESLAAIEHERMRRVLRQLERQVQINNRLSNRCASLAADLTVLTRISEAVLHHRDVDLALDDALSACFDASGVSLGALYLTSPTGELRARTLGLPRYWNDREVASFFGASEELTRILAAGEPVEIDAQQDTPFARGFLQRCRGNGALVVPLVHQERPLGALLLIASGAETMEPHWKTFAQGVGNQITLVLAMAEAFTEQRKAQKSAEESQAMWQSLVENAPDVVIHVDSEGRIKFVNRHDGDFVPWNARVGELLEPRSNAPTPDDPLREALARVLRHGESTSFESMHDGGARGVLWYSTQIGPIENSGSVVGAVLIARDITQRKHSDEQLLVADRMVTAGTLAAGVAHEINNPLASVMVNLDVIAREFTQLSRAIELPQEMRDSLQDARDSADRVKHIVRDLKIFSRSHDEKLGPVDAERVLESTLRMAWNEVRHRARLVRDYHQVLSVHASEARLGQVFLNLIVNAAQAIPDGHAEANTITITTAMEGEVVVISISDTGAGVKPEDRRRLFTPFFTTKPIGEGTGLGLSICHSIVSSMGGTISFESEVGKGTTFRVALPASHAAAAPSTTASRPTVATARLRILLIDDEVELATALSRMLGLDHDVTVFNFAEAALAEIARGSRYDIILCDVMMPQMSGVDFHQALEQVAPDQLRALIFLTGGAFSQRAREFLDTQVVRVLEKPFDLDQLRDLIVEITGVARA